MTLFELPLFSWSVLVATGVWVLAMPVWLGNLMISWVDFRGADALAMEMLRIYGDNYLGCGPNQ